MGQLSHHGAGRRVKQTVTGPLATSSPSHRVLSSHQRGSETRQKGRRGLIRRVQDTTRFGVELLAHKGGDSEDAAGCSGPLSVRA